MQLGWTRRHFGQMTGELEVEKRTRQQMNIDVSTTPTILNQISSKGGISNTFNLDFGQPHT